MTVFYVDDESIPRIIFEKIFEPKYSIMMADSGQEALKKLAQIKDDFIVIISDMRMPGMDGVDFIKEARAKYDNVACFILTSMDEEPKIQQAVEDSLISKVFHKPLNAAEVEAAIEEVVKRVA